MCLCPRRRSNFSYDADGNLTNDGRWTYTWDGENRLIQMTASTSVGPQQLIKFEYDPQGRRIHKQVWNNTGGSGNPAVDQRFLYDGWNLVATLTPNLRLNLLICGARDLSGSMQGAGGVGGLLEVSYHGTATTNCFPAFDGNGNVVALVNAADGTIVANYDYGPFGEPIRITGVMAKNNPFRFSTKYHDEESDLLYYGYRYYKPSTGTWPNRDPIGEKGGLNLYNFVDSDPIRKVDKLGLQEVFPIHDPDHYPPTPPTPPGEIVVTLPFPDPNNPDNGFLIENLNYVVNNAANNGFTYITVIDPTTLNKRLKMVCGCIGKLIITGHGRGGTQVFGPGDTTLDDRTLTVTYPPKGAPPVVQNIDLFSGIKFCKPCAIILAGCMVATGPDWKILTQAIHDKTGCSVWAYTTLGTNPRNGETPGPQYPGHWEGTE